MLLFRAFYRGLHSPGIGHVRLKLPTLDRYANEMEVWSQCQLEWWAQFITSSHGVISLKSDVRRAMGLTDICTGTLTRDLSLQIPASRQLFLSAGLAPSRTLDYHLTTTSLGSSTHLSYA